MADTLADTPLIAWMKQLDIPITRESFIQACWGDNPPDPWDAEAEDQIPKELQDWSWLPHPGNPETEYAASDLPPDPPEDDDPEGDLDDEEDADYGEDEDDEEEEE